MARFKFLGPRKFKGIAKTETKMIRLHRRDGTVQTLTPKPPSTRFVRGQDIGYDITDPRAIRVLESNPRYQRIS